MSINRSVLVSPKRWEGPLDADGPDSFIRISIGYKDFVAATATTNYDIPNFPGGLIVEDIFGVLRENFASGGAATATMSVGDTGGATKYGLAKSVFSGAPLPVWFANGDKGASLSSPQTAFLSGTSTPWATGTIRIQLIASVNTNLLTSGKLDLFLRLAATSMRP